jgi:hypothetical protein
MTEIVKVQLPVSSTVPAMADQALVYDEDRKRIVLQPLDRDTRMIMGDLVKAFFEADYRATDGTWTIGKRVKDRDW